MISRSIAGLALAALIAVPSIAGAQSSPMPMGSGMKMKSSMKKTTKSLKKETVASKHPKKAGQTESTVPGSPTYSGSSGTGK